MRTLIPLSLVKHSPSWRSPIDIPVGTCNSLFRPFTDDLPVFCALRLRAWKSGIGHLEAACARRRLTGTNGWCSPGFMQPPAFADHLAAARPKVVDRHESIRLNLQRECEHGGAPTLDLGQLLHGSYKRRAWWAISPSFGGRDGATSR